MINFIVQYLQGYC